MSLRRETGSALLIVLAFVAIMAVVLLAFLANSRRALQQSQSSATIVKTQMLGELATAAVIDDLLDEMKAGADEEPAADGPMTVSTGQAMVPYRILKAGAMATDESFANLVKQSATGQAFFPETEPYRRAGTLRSSTHNTETPAKNQRKISAERWNKPRLLGSATGVGSFSAGQLPDWIYITRNGVLRSASDLDVSKAADKAPSNTGYILGRFAYNIYQVDGLLDINVAGFSPSDASSSVFKGSLAWADLRAIPGLSTDSEVRQLVDWRNKQTRSDYAQMIAGLPPANPNATPGPWGEPGGFQKAFTDGSRSDNRFFTRQDLLNYVDSQFDVSAEVSKALPFLTTFSADLDQPSYRPDPARPPVKSGEDDGGNDAYKDESEEVSEQINPALLSVRDDDGEPLVKRRFPLERLKHIVSDPSGDEATQIEQYFGLRWVGNGTWTYIDDNRISRLHEIEDREPNMIELLKAAISIGSLGGQAVNSTDNRAALLKERDSSIDTQVMRIAACIIDQYDADGYPTNIRFKGNTVSGVEDLPYLYGFRIAPYRQLKLSPVDNYVSTSGMVNYPKDGTTPLDDLYRNVVMIQPIIWNPHAPSAGSRPSAFRISASTNDGGSTARVDVVPQSRKPWWKNVGSFVSDWPVKPGNLDPRDSGEPRAFDPSEDYMTFSVSPVSSDPASFREPYILKSPNYPPGSNARSFSGPQAGLPGGEVIEPTLGPNEQNAGESSSHTIGFRTGWCWSGPYWNGGGTVSSTNPNYLQLGLLATAGIHFELQYQGPSGDWITYDRFEKFTNNNENYRLDRLNSGVATINPRLMRHYVRVDPRVDRYGARAPLLQPSSWMQGESMREGTAPGVISQTGWPSDATYRFTVPADNEQKYIGLLSQNRSTDIVRYLDPDGVQRVAMGGYAAGTSVSGLPMAKGNFESRPMVLNRPFRSVAELSYVLRDQPWKQLDFFSPQSGDAALLDMFCIYEPKAPESDPIVAGRVNVNTRRSEVLESLLRGVGVTDGVVLSDTDAQRLAQALIDWTSSTEKGKGPLRNRSEVVGRFVETASSDNHVYNGFSSQFDAVFTGDTKAITARRQNILRALTDPVTTRAWTFLIDLIVQDGQFTTTGSAAAEDFVVRGEKRYWIHVSMDRFSGKVIAKRLEEVHE